MVTNTIALQGQPIAAPDILGMAGKAANVKNSLAQSDAYKAQEKKIQYATELEKSNSALRFVNNPQQFKAWAASNYNNPILGEMLTRMGGSIEDSNAAIDAASQSPEGFAQLMQQASATSQQMADVFGGQINRMRTDRKTAAANARNAQFMSAVYGDGGGAGSVNNLGGGAPAPANVNALTSPAPTESTVMRPPPPGAENLPMSPPVTVTAQAPAPAAPAAPSPFEQFQARKEQLFAELSRIEDYLRRDPQSQIAAKRKKEVQDELKFNDSQIKSAREQIDFSQKQQELIDKKNAPPKLTEDQSKTSYNLGRIVSSMDQIASATENTPAAIAPKGLEATVKALPLWQSASGELTNLTRGPDRQIVAAAQRDMIDALLFLATGAAYNEYQLQGQIESLLPSFSDEPSAVAAKQTRLLELVDRAKARAGQGWTPEIDKQFNELVNASFSKKENAAKKAQSSIRSAADAIINGVK
jgi:hypothetical protein